MADCPGPLARASLASLPGDGRLVVGFSGGADSVALAHWLLEQGLKSRILLAHVNHLLRGEEAERDQRFAEDFAQSRGLALQVLRADVGTLARQRGQGAEECGRQVRYDFFESLAPGCQDRILTAHHADDNAETILLNLCRGAALEGLCGIPPARGKVLRPLLEVSREEIERYCQDQGLDFVTDSSNLENSYTRNRLRHQVLPVLKEINPRFVQAAGQAAQLLRADGLYLGQEALRLLDQAQTQQGLLAARLLEAPPSLWTRTLKLYLEQAGCGRLEKKHLDQAGHILQKGGAASLPGGVQVRCAQGMFWAGKESPPQENAPYEIPLKPGENPLPGGKILVLTQKIRSETENQEKIQKLLFKNALDCAIMDDTLIARNRRPGDRLAPAGRGLTKPLKQLFQEQRLPAPLRQQAVLLVSGGKIAWCQGVGTAEGFQPPRGCQTWLAVEIRQDCGK